jgi:mannose-1-phosphate guanylyltransferase
VAKSSSADHIVLLGVVPDRLELEYGWIIPDSIHAKNRPRTYSVRSFVEKPTMEEAKAALNSGALWNTFVLVGSVERLWQLGWK